MTTQLGYNTPYCVHRVLSTLQHMQHMHDEYGHLFHAKNVMLERSMFNAIASSLLCYSAAAAPCGVAH